MSDKSKDTPGYETTDGILILPKLASRTTKAGEGEKKEGAASKSAPRTRTVKSAVKKTAKSPVSKAKAATSEQNLPWLKVYPKKIKWDMKIPEKPAYSLLDETVEKVPNNICFDFLGKKATYATVGEMVNRAAKGLQDLGVKKGTKVGIFMPNSGYFVIAYFAILKAGGVVVNYNPLYAEDELIYQINNSQTEIILTLDLKALCDKIVPLLGVTTLQKIIHCSVGKSLPFPKNILFPIVKRKEVAKFPQDERIIPFAKLVDNAGDVAKVSIDPKEDIALLQYTGGTTGVPKGAMLTHANIYANAYQASNWFPEYVMGEERILAALPLFHVFAMTAVMNLAIRMGAEIVMMFPRFNVEDAIKMIDQHKITFLPAVPTIYNMINNFKDTKKYDLSSVRMCLSGGAPLPYQVKHDFEALTGCKLVEAYGLSETSPAATSNPVDGENKVGSIGIPFPGTVVKVVSLEDSTKEMPLGEIGQIAIKGPQVMKGYWQQPEETAKVFSEGFFLTGDMGYMDEEGYTFLVDRLKDMIICSGFNVYPRHVEEAIYKHPAVEEVTVIGVPDDKRGESVKAFIKVKQSATLTEKDLHDFLENKLSPIEMPKYVEFRDALPKTMIGKLSKKELKLEEKARKRP